MADRFDGKVALVTGGSSGIGRAAALAFAHEKAKVVIADVAVEGGEETVAMIKRAGGDALFVSTDVSQASAVEALMAKVLATYGRLDCAHNNAGISSGVRAATADVPEDVWDRVIAINLKGVWLSMKYEIPLMLAHGGGAIVNMSSGFGLVGNPNGGAAYVTSKHGIVGLTKTAALEYAKAGIRINAVCPGVIRTPLIEHIMQREPQFAAQMTARHPIGRFGTVEEVAETILWLCSDAASFVTGHAMAVDGGFVAQ